MKINFFFQCRILGTPDHEIWPDVKSLPHFKESFPKFPGNPLEAILQNLDPLGINLLSKMLFYDPNKRITAKQALLHVRTFEKIYFIYFYFLAILQEY
jgi:cyclin-dependent kinase 2